MVLPAACAPNLALITLGSWGLIVSASPQLPQLQAHVALNVASFPASLTATPTPSPAGQRGALIASVALGCQRNPGSQIQSLLSCQVHGTNTFIPSWLPHTGKVWKLFRVSNGKDRNTYLWSQPTYHACSILGRSWSEKLTQNRHLPAFFSLCLSPLSHSQIVILFTFSAQ